MDDGRAQFRVWAPIRESVEVHIHSPREQILPMEKDGAGYFRAWLENPPADLRYTFRLDGEVERPDPASGFQPDGVHAPSALVDHEFEWTSSEWHGIPLSDYLIYEIHVGAFTKAGTFDAAIERIPYLRELGITAVELMPVAANPGERNWGYDGVYPFAVQANYGGPQGLKRFVDACHNAGLAVVLDVVYNHMGPEGNYLRDFGPYFTDRHHTPWGDAINYDGPDCGPVRDFVIQNALHWVTEYRIDALRLDATDTIYDVSPRHLLADLAEAIRERAEELNRRIYAIAETAANDSRWVRVPEQGGFGLHAQWMDDYHHALRCALTGESQGYYADYPDFRHLVKSLREGYVYSGEYSAYRRRAHGNSTADLPPGRFVVCCQNHDQVGNRMLGDRLGRKVDLASLKLAAAWVILSPYIPLLFMGEEYNETAPFPYFVSHGDEDLIRAVREGRRREFEAFAWEGEPPDPQAVETFESAKIDPELRKQGEHRALFWFYQELIRLRKELDAIHYQHKRWMRVEADEATRAVFVERRYHGQSCVLIYCFDESASDVRFPLDGGAFRKLLDSEMEAYGGRGSSHSSELVLAHGDTMRLAPRSAMLLERMASPEQNGN